MLTRTPGGTTSTGTGTSTTITGLAAGTYTYTVTNAYGCASIASGNVVINTQPATPTAPIVGTITQPTCILATGSVVLTGLPAGDWTINPGSVAGTGSSFIIPNLTEGTYNYTVTNAAGCTSPASADVVIAAQPATPIAPVVGTITNPTCSVATGSFLLSSLPSSGTWTLIRYPGAIATSGTGTSTNISDLPAGSYNYTVTNASGCISVISPDIVINPQPVAATASSAAATAVASTTVTINGTINANGTSTNVTFEYGPTPGYGSSINAVPSPVIGTNPTAVSANITGLTANTTYYYRVKAVVLVVQLMAMI